jgi:hypothetical protein
MYVIEKDSQKGWHGMKSNFPTKRKEVVKWKNQMTVLRLLKIIHAFSTLNTIGPGSDK